MTNLARAPAIRPNTIHNRMPTVDLPFEVVDFRRERAARPGLVRRALLVRAGYAHRASPAGPWRARQGCSRCPASAGCGPAGVRRRAPRSDWGGTSRRTTPSLWPRPGRGRSRWRGTSRPTPPRNSGLPRCASRPGDRIGRDKRVAAEALARRGAGRGVTRRWAQATGKAAQAGQLGLCDLCLHPRQLQHLATQPLRVAALKGVPAAAAPGHVNPGARTRERSVT
jgi:hypothetical protein